jgi:hypothetical protein
MLYDVGGAYIVKEQAAIVVGKVNLFSGCYGFVGGGGGDVKISVAAQTHVGVDMSAYVKTGHRCKRAHTQSQQEYDFCIMCRVL